MVLCLVSSLDCFVTYYLSARDISHLNSCDRDQIRPAFHPSPHLSTYTNLSHSGQTPSEVTLIKCFDSKLDGRARRVPHTAFVNPATIDEEARESIEVRALVFSEDTSAE